MRVADRDHDNGAFASLTTNDAMSWLMALGPIKEVDPRMKAARNPQEQREIAIENLRVALWDIQRFDHLFPSHVYSKTPNFKVSRLDYWPKWKEPHKEVRVGGPGPQKVDAYKDAKRLKSYVMTHFNTLAFTQPELAQSLPNTPPQGPAGNWIGTKKAWLTPASTLLPKLILDKGGRDTPFVVYFQHDVMLIMEILEVKRISWPEPGPEASSTEYLYEPCAPAPLVPMMETPKIPLVLVRYSYMEGRPEGGSEFLTLHLEARVRELLPRGTSDDDVRVELETRLSSGEEMPVEHLRMFARLLSHNADLIDQEWAADQQSHWNIPTEVKNETHISFFVPCLRPRFKAVEEIETGKVPAPYAQCGECKKDATKRCAARKCRAVCYCSRECAKANWSQHKADCKVSKKIASDPDSLPKDTLYIPVCAYIHWTLDFGFASEQEGVKMGGPPTEENPRNEYGPERFVCRVALPDVGQGQWDPHQGKVIYHDRGGTAYLYDRRRSVIVRLGPQEPTKAMVHGVTIPFHEAGYRKLSAVVRERGAQGQLLFVWVRRVGDCIEVDLKDIPDQRVIRWD
ncbi:hypothetical protein B0H17DRAFT_942527 [Mycena rosella]|uniref:MYND-type domain-containing protein n=1 Tax=Mycena rosella TaxID=1033263 RepID=A0AAD7D7M6_MYCRO|nr:hypothetical protein B0H17DRAFT_942527 [Mycena rosella]